jgi:hypothetical protein
MKQFKMKALLAGVLAFLSSSGTVLGGTLYSQRTYDASLLLKAAALVGATADGSLILDVGNGCLEADVVVDVTACELATDESYEIVIQGSPDAAFGTAGNIVALGSLTIMHSGAARATAMGQGAVDTGVGRHLFGIRNEKNGVTYRYLRLRTIVVGTIASGINYSAWLAKDD